VGSIAVGQRPWGVALLPDGRTVYTANGPSNDVSVVDLMTQQVVKKIPVGDRPWGLTVLNPSGAR
jgi:YVTN family beta-propeller protein